MTDNPTFKITYKSNKMPRRPRSVVWYYFDKIPNEPHKSRCKLCGSVCNNPSNTSNLFKHLRAKHPVTYKEAETRRKSEMEMYYELKVKSVRPVPRTETRGRRPASLTQPANIAVVKAEETLPNNDSPPFVKNMYSPEKFKQVKMRALLKMISVDLQSPSIVDEEGFREFVHALDNRFELPAKKVVTKSLLPELAEETKHKMKLGVVMASFFAVTVESWNYKNSHSFMTLTAHFIKDSWEMSSVVLETMDCTEDMTETGTASNFKRITDEWGITDRIIALIANTSGDVISSATLINGWEELICFGNSLNLVVESALMSQEELVRIQKKVIEVVTYFENSTKASDTLAAIQQQHGIPVHKLKQKNPRFWTSMYAMFERMVEQFEAVNTVLCFLEKDHLCLCDDDVDLIKNVIEILVPFEAAIKELCADQYTCMSKVIPIATLLQQVTSTGIATDHGPHSALKNALITQMQTRFSNLESNHKLAISTLLDPRFKHHAFTDSSALELAQQRLLSETATVVQNSDMQDMDNDTSFTVDNSRSSLWIMFDRKVSEAGAMKTSTSDAENECRRYFKEANIPRNGSALNWWKLNEVQFPHLKVLAQKYLAIPATAVASSRLFTNQGDLVSLRRDQIKPSFINTMIFLNKNLQVSLLVIILEQQNKEDGDPDKILVEATSLERQEPCISVSACAQRLVEAVNMFISAGERQIQALRYKDLVDDMAAACEMLTMASDNLFIQAQRYEVKNASGNMKNILVQAAKDVLQGVLKVLLVKDDYSVRQLLEKTDSVVSLIRTVERVRDKTELISTFKAITFAVLSLKMELGKRCQDLCSKSCRDEIMTWVSVLQNSVPSLSLASQTYLKYRASASALASRDSVMQEIVEACRKICQHLQSGPQDKDEDDLISFVVAVDKVINNLSEVNRGSLHPDTVTDIVFLIDHSLSVAHCTHGVYRELIVSSCHRILQCKFRLLDLNAAMKEKPALVQMRSEFESVCETTLDLTCELEKHVNMALLQLIIETFQCPLERLAYLKDVASARSKGERSVSHKDVVITEFVQYTEQLCQVALLVAASSTDSHKTREIVAAVRCLASLDPDIAPAVIVLSKDPKNQAARKHLDLLLGRWVQEVSTVIDSVDSLVDPNVFMNMSEDVLAQEIEVLKTLRDAPHSDIQLHFNRFVSLSKRPGALAKKLVDKNSDPVYRNGLNYFIAVLFQRINEAKNVYLEIMQTHQPPIQQFDTLERRLNLVLQAVRMLREGLDVKSHPHLLSAKRVMFQPRGLPLRKDKPHCELKRVEVKGRSVETKVKVMKVKEVNTDSQKNTKHTEKLTEPAMASQNQAPPEQSTRPTKTEPSVLLPAVFREKELEGGPGAEIYKVAKKLLTAFSQSQHKDLDVTSHDLLGWTNHIVESAEKLMAHCSKIPKVRQLKDLLVKLGRLTPEISQKTKFVLAGDKQAGQELLEDAVEWAEAANSARIIVDVAVDRWLVLTTGLRQTVENHDERQSKMMLNTMNSAQREMCGLLGKTQSLSGKYVENSVQRAKMLADLRNTLENLMLTISTFVDVAAVSEKRTTDNWWQLAMVCRDWSVAMASAASELDAVSDMMEFAGQGRFRLLQVGAGSKSFLLVSAVEEEMDCVLESVDCVVVGDSTLKARGDELVAKLETALADLKTAARLPVNAGGSSTEDIFSGLQFRQATSMWIETALDVQGLVRNNCFEYLGFTNQILLRALEVSLSEDLDNDAKAKQRQELSSHFLERSQQLKQQALKVIQLDPDHTRRVVVRSTLDHMSKLTTQIEGLVRLTPRLTDADVSSLSEQWAARMKKLVHNLRRMDGEDSSIVLEIERMNKASFSTHHHQQPHHHKTRHTPKELLPKKQHLAKGDHQPSSLEQRKQVPLNYPPLDDSYDWPNQQNVCGQGRNMNPASEGDARTCSRYRNDSEDMSIPSRKDSSVQILLSDASYLSNRLNKWQDTETRFEKGGQRSKVIESALDMAHLCSEIARFTRGQGSLKDSEEVIDAALAVVRHSLFLEEFGRCLLMLTSHSKCVDSLEACVTRMNTCASQLHVISTVLHNSAKSFQGDHILMRNAVNLLLAVRQMFSVAESLAVKGVKEPAHGDEATREALFVLRKIQTENQRYIRQEREAACIDDLGLRRMELHNPPTLTSLVNLNDSQP